MDTEVTLSMKNTGGQGPLFFYGRVQTYSLCNLDLGSGMGLVLASLTWFWIRFWYVGLNGAQIASFKNSSFLVACKSGPKMKSCGTTDV